MQETRVPAATDGDPANSRATAPLVEVKAELAAHEMAYKRAEGGDWGEMLPAVAKRWGILTADVEAAATRLGLTLQDTKGAA